MLDKSTVVCYLKGSKDVILPNFPDDVPWNNKKWRCLFFFSDNWKCLFAGRQYPFSTDNALDIVKKLIIEPLTNDYWEDWRENSFYSIGDTELSCNHVIVQGYCLPIKDIVIDAQYSKHYNDLLYSSCYKPMYTETKDFRAIYARDKNVFHIGAAVPCLICEKNHVSEAETMLCRDCELKYGTSVNEDFGFCECCGRRVFWDSTSYVSVGDGEYQHICEHCVRNECTICDECGELVYNSFITYDCDKEEYLCDRCCREEYE